MTLDITWDLNYLTIMFIYSVGVEKNIQEEVFYLEKEKNIG